MVSLIFSYIFIRERTGLSCPRIDRYSFECDIVAGYIYFVCILVAGSESAVRCRYIQCIDFIRLYQPVECNRRERDRHGNGLCSLHWQQDIFGGKAGGRVAGAFYCRICVNIGDRHTDSDRGLAPRVIFEPPGFVAAKVIFGAVAAVIFSSLSPSLTIVIFRLVARR